MKNIKRLFQKDRFGFVRGTAAMCLVLLLIGVLFAWILSNQNSTDAEQRAADSAKQIAVKYQMMIEDGFHQMFLASQQIQETPEDAIDHINNLVRYGNFSDAMLVSEGMEYHLDGTTSEAKSILRSTDYQSDEVKGRIIDSGNNGIQLRISIGASAELAAWVDPVLLDWILQSAYEEDYGYVIFNSATGTYLLNMSGYTGGGYYDTLLMMNEDGRLKELLRSQVAQAHVSLTTNEGGAEYIAQTDTGINPWSIALFIPAELLDQDERGVGMTAMLLGGATLLLILAMVVYVVFIMHRMRQENRTQMRKFNVSNKTISLLAKDSKSRVYLYQRKQDRMIVFFDGMKGETEAADIDAPKNLAELGQYSGLTEANTELLRDRIRELKAGEKSSFNMRCEEQENKHLLRFMLNSVEEYEDLVLGTMRDSTADQQTKIRFSDEREFRRRILPKSSCVWQISFARNRWKLTDSRPEVDIKGAGVKLNAWRDYEVDMNGLARDYLHADDYLDYLSKMSIDFIMDAFDRGTFQHVMEYRLLDGERQYQWYRQVMRVYRNPDSGEIEANMYLLNVDAEKNAEMERKQRTRIIQQTLTALSGIYYGLYYVNLDGDLCHAVRTHGGEMISKMSMPFRETIDNYIQKYVHPDDRNRLGKMLDSYNIRKNIREGSHDLRCTYRRCVGDIYMWSELTVQAARFENGTVREIILALRDVNSEHQVTQEQHA